MSADKVNLDKGLRAQSILEASVDPKGRTLVFSDVGSLAALKKRFAGKRIKAEFSEIKNIRSDRQNRYYWGVLIDAIARRTGYSVEEAHEAMKMKFLRKYDEKLNLYKVRSTASLDTGEAEDYFADIREWASDFLDEFIPLPNEEIY